MHHFALLTSEMGLVSRVSPVQTALRNCTRDEGRAFEVGNQVLISSHGKLLSSKAASFGARRNKRRLLKAPDSFGPVRPLVTVAGWRGPVCAMAVIPRKRMGPPLRSFAADAHGCIMVRVLGPTGYKVVARLIRARKRAPL